MQDLKHKILLALVALTIIGEVASIMMWVVNPALLGNSNARFTLAVDYTVAVTNAAVFAILNSIAFILILRKNKIGSILLITISFINRVVSHPIFIGGVHLIFVAWTTLLIIFAYLEYRKLSKQK